ncbi:carboxymuconolactone decarboxylase family protein [Streptomyces sp. NBC_01477]|uniref:carboxymuconolactone decarboxylase family protein n=1 Tax=Streptomyces sp. NBC_01477 TaxID=2976015 RepID=UPI002E35C0DA|nr:hypothetical protein [Streptomyces sp. NBC_01477]
MSRISFPDWSVLSLDTQAAVDRFPVLINSVRALTAAPTLTAPLLDLVTSILTRLEISARHREMLILLISYETDCVYEWVQHVPQAHRAGFPDEEFPLLIDEERRSADEADNALLKFARCYLRSSGCDEAHLHLLREHFSDRQTAEVLLLLGAVRMFTLYINALGLEIDAAGPELARRFAALAGQEQ